MNGLVAARRLGGRSRAYARHVYQKIAALTIGALFVSRGGRAVRRTLAAARAPVPRPHLRLAVVAHAYYLDLLPEILACRAVLGDDVPLHLTMPPDRVAAAESALRGVPQVTLHACENRGRDIAPFLSLLNAGAFDAFDAVLKLHTKRSPHLLDGEIRRKLLFAALCGERKATYRALRAFAQADTGLMGWGACWRTAPPYWMGNEARVRAIAARMGAPAEAIRLGFFEGTIFWFRPAALAPLRDLRLDLSDFEAEERQLDGTLHHAVERTFTIAARTAGFVVRDRDGRALR